MMSHAMAHISCHPYVLHRTAAGSGHHQRPKVAKGVLVSATCPETKRTVRVAVRAAAVVSSCGSLQTPALLLRSGVTCNGAVGRNLRLHPASVLVARFPRGADGHKSDPGQEVATGQGDENKACTVGAAGQVPGQPCSPRSVALLRQEGKGGSGQSGQSESPFAGSFSSWVQRVASDDSVVTATEGSDGSWEELEHGTVLGADVAAVVKAPAGAASSQAVAAAPAAAGAEVAAQGSKGATRQQRSKSGEHEQGQQGQQQRGYGPEHFAPLLKRGQPSVDMWAGGMMTVFSRFKAGWDGCGYGPMLSVAVVSGLAEC
jgi:hypothetical protein